ncbi:hypothetical protein GCM10022271_22790 [Corallibacter vietnamensis]|uniref:Transmembrane protein n=1 Tax=Corallibacter vietnamensis TaxID=904130 RepID=A0ABP7HAT6_9FLAO
MSSIVNVADVMLILPQPSVAVNCTVADPVSPQSSDKVLKLFVQTTAEQSSVAVAPPLEFNQAFNSAVLPNPSHSTVKLLALVISGAIVSWIIYVAEVVD